MKSIILILFASFYVAGCASSPKTSLRSPASNWQARITQLPSGDGTIGCAIFLDPNRIIRGPSYEQMLHLMELKPSTKALVGKYLMLGDGVDPVEEIPKLAYWSERKFKGVPDLGKYTLECNKVEPLAAELNVLFSSQMFSPSPLPDVVAPKVKAQHGDGPAVFPAECYGKLDLVGCKAEVEKRLRDGSEESATAK